MALELVQFETPEQRLQQDEDAIAREEFADYLDTRNGDHEGLLRIENAEFKASDVLLAMDPELYEELFIEFKDSQLEYFKQSAVHDFASPIAYYLYRFENGWENENQRLTYLRDTWEAAIRLVHALVVGEARLLRVPLQNSGVRFSFLFSESMNRLLENVEAVLAAAADAGMEMACQSLLMRDVIGRMKRLNQVRNGFSHAATLSEFQSSQLVQVASPEVLGVLKDLLGLKEVVVMRYLQQVGVSVRRENHTGYALVRKIDTFNLPLVELGNAMPYLDRLQVLAFWSGRVIPLCPFVYFRETPTGQGTQLCFLKRREGSVPNQQLEYEIIGDSEPWFVARSLLSSHFDDIRSLFGLLPEG